MKDGGTPGRGSPVSPGVPASGREAGRGGGGDTEPRMIAAADLLAAMNTDPGTEPAPVPEEPEPPEPSSDVSGDASGDASDDGNDLPEGVVPLGRTDPSHVGAFELLGRIGAGGMGAVFLGRDDRGRMGAVKLIRPEYAADPSFLARFQDEVALADRVSPFCTAQVLDHGIAEHNRPYLVTEYVEGLSLERQVLEHGALPAANLHGVAVGVAAALTAIHAAGLVHRDLKPANVILSWSGPRVIDFGIARAMDAPHGRTQKGIVLGSPGWMSPEQLAGAPVTPSSDIFNWGCLVAFAANGRHPFGEGDPVTMAGRMMHGRPNLGDLEEPLRGLAAAAMSKDPARRPTARYLMLGSLGRPEAKRERPPEAAESIPDTRSAVNAVLHRWQPPAPPPFRRPPPPMPGPRGPRPGGPPMPPPAGPPHAGPHAPGPGTPRAPVPPPLAGQQGPPPDAPRAAGPPPVAGQPGPPHTDVPRTAGPPPQAGPPLNDVPRPAGPIGPDAGGAEHGAVLPTDRRAHLAAGAPGMAAAPGAAGPDAGPSGPPCPGASGVPQGGPPPSGPIPVVPPPPGSGPGPGGRIPRPRLPSPGFPWWVVLAAMLVLLVVLLGGLLMMTRGGAAPTPRPGGGHDRQSQPARTGQSPIATTGGKTANPDEFGPGTVKVHEPGADNGTRFLVNSVSCGTKQLGKPPSPLTANGTFCLADVRVTNTGGHPATAVLDPDEQRLYDTKGRSYPAVAYASQVAGGPNLFAPIKPGQTTSGMIVFDMPPSAAADHLVLHGIGGTGKGLTVTL